MTEQSKYHVFWEALFVTILVFGIGIVLGIYFEQIRSDNSNALFYNSEAALFDTIAFTEFINSENISCEQTRNVLGSFADKIYLEAKQLDQFEDSTKLSSSIKAIHRKYDTMRTILWIKTLQANQKCNNFNTVVYFYLLDPEDLTIRAKQNVWGKVLFELKQKKGSEVILIPIAANNDVGSLEQIIKIYNVTSFPSVIINRDNVIYNLQSADELEKYLE